MHSNSFPLVSCGLAALTVALAAPHHPAHVPLQEQTSSAIAGLNSDKRAATPQRFIDFEVVTCGERAAGLGEGHICDGSILGTGKCCSPWGFCGDTSVHCGQGCQPEYGQCYELGETHHDENPEEDEAKKKKEDEERKKKEDEERKKKEEEERKKKEEEERKKKEEEERKKKEEEERKKEEEERKKEEEERKKKEEEERKKKEAEEKKKKEAEEKKKKEAEEKKKKEAEEKKKKEDEEKKKKEDEEKKKNKEDEKSDAGNQPGRCGPQFGRRRCPGDECCSFAGYCGRTTLHCRTPECQLDYGTCDSVITPGGPSTAKDPRPKIGPVPYAQPIYHCKKEKVVALTYDDGPTEYTNEVLNLLQKYGFRATFFVSGNSNGKGPIDWSGDMTQTVVRMHREDHQVASHSWSHYNLDKLNSSMRISDMVKNERAIANIIGRYPTYMRPPYNSCTRESGCIGDMKKLGYHIIHQDLDTGDWSRARPDWVQACKDNIKKGLDRLPENGNAISIQHDLTHQSATEISAYLFEQIVAKGWKGVTVGECFQDAPRNWYRIPKIRSPNFEYGDDEVV